MSSSSFRMSDFVPVDGSLVVQTETEVTFTFSSAYVVSVHVDLWAEDGTWGAVPQDVALDGNDDRTMVFGIPQTDLHYRITVKGESGSSNTVYVRIEW